MTLSELADRIEATAEKGGSGPQFLDFVMESMSLVHTHAAVLAEALRLCDLAEYIIDEDYKAADSRVSAEFKTRYRALCEEVSRE